MQGGDTATLHKALFRESVEESLGIKGNAPARMELPALHIAIKNQIAGAEIAIQWYADRAGIEDMPAADATLQSDVAVGADEFGNVRAKP